VAYRKNFIYWDIKFGAKLSEKQIPARKAEIELHHQTFCNLNVVFFLILHLSQTLAQNNFTFYFPLNLYWRRRVYAKENLLYLTPVFSGCLIKSFKRIKNQEKMKNLPPKNFYNATLFYSKTRVKDPYYVTVINTSGIMSK
jgi:hypothetical protein